MLLSDENLRPGQFRDHWHFFPSANNHNWKTYYVLTFYIQYAQSLQHHHKVINIVISLQVLILRTLKNIVRQLVSHTVKNPCNVRLTSDYEKLINSLAASRSSSSMPHLTRPVMWCSSPQSGFSLQDQQESISSQCARQPTKHNVIGRMAYHQLWHTI